MHAHIGRTEGRRAYCLVGVIYRSLELGLGQLRVPVQGVVLKDAPVTPRGGAEPASGIETHGLDLLKGLDSERGRQVPEGEREGQSAQKSRPQDLNKLSNRATPLEV